jgi:fibronectin-binding autotransporter adhesin
MVGDVAAGAAAGSVVFAVRLDPNAGSDYIALTTTGTIADDGANGVEPTPADNTDTEVTPLYQGIYAVSPGVALPRRGGPPVVRVFDVATNTQIFAINAYDASYRDSIRIAMGDINGDGYDDIITSTRKTTGSVRVFDGRTGERFEGAFAEIAAFTEKGARGAFVASGDVTGDGRDDISVGSGQGARGSAKVKVFDGRTGDLVSTSEPFGTKFRGGVRVAAGDVNGDGLADIIAAQGYGGNDVKVTSGTSTTVLHNLEIGGSRYRGGVFVAVANLDGDDSADLIVGRDRGPTVIETFSGATGTLANTIVPFGPKYRLGVRVAAADINFDGIADIVAGAGGRGRSEVKIFDGTTGSVLHTFTAFPTHLTGSLFVAGTSPVPAVAQFNEQPA